MGVLLKLGGGRVDEEGPIEETIELIDSDSDERGFFLRIESDEGERFWFRIRDSETARAALAAVSKLRPWIDEYDRQKAAYLVASQEERDRVIGREPPDDPAEQLREETDLRRKAERENPTSQEG